METLVLNSEYLTEIILTQKREGVFAGLEPPAAVCALHEMLMAMGIYFLDSWEGPEKDLAEALLLDDEQAATTLSHVTYYLQWTNYAYDHIKQMEANGRDLIRNLQPGGSEMVDFFVVEFPPEKSMPSFATFGFDRQLAEKLRNELCIPMHTGRISKPRGGSFGSRVKRMSMNDYGTLNIYTGSSNHSLMRHVIQQIHPKKKIEILPMH